MSDLLDKSLIILTDDNVIKAFSWDQIKGIEIKNSRNEENVDDPFISE